MDKQALPWGATTRQNAMSPGCFNSTSLRFAFALSVFYKLAFPRFTSVEQRRGGTDMPDLKAAVWAQMWRATIESHNSGSRLKQTWPLSCAHTAPATSVISPALQRSSCSGFYSPKQKLSHCILLLIAALGALRCDGRLFAHALLLLLVAALLPPLCNSTRGMLLLLHPARARAYAHSIAPGVVP